MPGFEQNKASVAPWGGLVQVALAKGFVDDMRARYVELEDHTHQLHAEAEQLCRQVRSPHGVSRTGGSHGHV